MMLRSDERTTCSARARAGVLQGGVGSSRGDLAQLFRFVRLAMSLLFALACESAVAPLDRDFELLVHAVAGRGRTTVQREEPPWYENDAR